MANGDVTQRMLSDFMNKLIREGIIKKRINSNSNTNYDENMDDDTPINIRNNTLIEAYGPVDKIKKSIFNQPPLRPIKTPKVPTA